ncbi:MAG TPA: DUF1269 domain-containing protein [Thermomicrobiales bacterium]|jgi:uncharacterized membrane protein
MATAVALIFPDQGTAEQALAAARALEHAGDATFLESGLLVKTAIDKAEMTKDGWKSEIVFGGVAGGVLGALILGVPILGAAGGALAGRHVWKHKDSQEAFRAFADQVKHEMPEGGAAVVALVESTNPARVRAELGTFGGTLFATDVPPAEIAAIQAEMDTHRR